MADLLTSIDVCQGAIRNGAVITAIVATDAAESERSVCYSFSAEDSETILRTVLGVLQNAKAK